MGTIADIADGIKVVVSEAGAKIDRQAERTMNSMERAAIRQSHKVEKGIKDFVSVKPKKRPGRPPKADKKGKGKKATEKPKKVVRSKKVVRKVVKKTEAKPVVVVKPIVTLKRGCVLPITRPRFRITPPRPRLRGR